MERVSSNQGKLIILPKTIESAAPLDRQVVAAAEDQVTVIVCVGDDELGPIAIYAGGIAQKIGDIDKLDK